MAGVSQNTGREDAKIAPEPLSVEVATRTASPSSTPTSQPKSIVSDESHNLLNQNEMVVTAKRGEHKADDNKSIVPLVTGATCAGLAALTVVAVLA